MSTPLSQEEAFARLGAITREMHEALSVLGQNQLHNIVGEMPDARERLSYVGKMTEDAANKVLSLVEESMPGCDEFAAQGGALSQALCARALAPEALLEQCTRFASQAQEFAGSQSAVMSDIMMAQSFQDLSGQVIKKVVDIISRTERQLVHLLLDSAPQTAGSTASTADATPANVDTHVLDGPQTADNALAQNDVDDLLASLGF